MERTTAGKMESLGDYCLFHEDCLETSVRLPENSVDLIYADPPFCTGRSHYMHGYEFEDRWSERREYLDWMMPRLSEFRRILKQTGTLYLHCDWHVSHYLKALADTLFGANNFLNEIVWKRQSAHNDSRQGSRHFGRVHDSILVYTKSSKYVWNQQYATYDESYLRRAYRYVDPKTGRRYALGDLTAPGGPAKGNAHYEFLGVERYWRYSKPKMFELMSAGRIKHAKGEVPRLKRYLDEMAGRPIQDIWTDINPMSRSNILYPTQKPEDLLTRIIMTSSNENQLIYDPFTGSGVTAAVAFRTSRRWIGSEISHHACRLVVNRMTSLGYNLSFHECTEESKCRRPIKVRRMRTRERGWTKG